MIFTNDLALNWRGAAFGHKSGVSNPSVKCDKQGGSNLRTSCGLGEESWGGSKGIWFRMAGCTWRQNTKHKTFVKKFVCGGLVVVWRSKSCLKFVAIRRFVGKNLLQFGGVWFGGDTGSIAKLMVLFFGGCLCVKLVGKRLKKMQNRGQIMCACQVLMCFLYVCTPDFKRSSSLNLFAK